MTEKFWTPKEAAEYASKQGIFVSRPTVIKWCREHNLGHQLGGKTSGKWGRWFIGRKKFRKFLRGPNVKKGKKV